MLVTIGVARNKKPGVKGSIADQQLVRVTAIHGSNTCPQSIRTSGFSIVSSGCNGLTDFSFKVGLVSSLVINEDDFTELIKTQTKNVIFSAYTLKL